MKKIRGKKSYKKMKKKTASGRSHFFRVITLNVDGLNSPIEDREIGRLHLKSSHNYMLSKR